MSVPRSAQKRLEDIRKFRAALEKGTSPYSEEQVALIGECAGILNQEPLVLLETLLAELNSELFNDASELKAKALEKLEELRVRTESIRRESPAVSMTTRQSGDLEPTLGVSIIWRPRWLASMGP
jgi:hypothetical protein